MSSRKSILFIVTVLMVAAAGVGLARFHTIQKLGRPGVRTVPLGNSGLVEVVLPETAPNFTGRAISVTAIETNTLPKDTCYGKMNYTAADGFNVAACVVLMGADRTSLHKPQFCLEGAGWHIDPSASMQETIHITKPTPYDLPVVKLVATAEYVEGGQRKTLRGVYVYWYVADNAISASQSGFQRMWWMARELMRTGVLQRWAYVSYLGVCNPGYEDQAFERMKTLIAETVPSYQLYPGSGATLAATGK